MTVGPSAANLPRPGDMVAGKYVIDRLLGRGGMGAVFAARHVKLAKPVAIKIMLADAANPEAAHRFINEGRAAANIQNEHVVRVDDVDEEFGYAYMVLELLDGEDLAQLLERHGRLPAGIAADYAIQALRGVMQAHAIGIVHRDLKPSNLFVARRKDGSVVVKVLDFGISKTQASSALLASPNALTSTKAMLGSPLYMSPEQLRSAKNVDQRADIWAMGIILYELVTGKPPHRGENLGELFAAILEMDPQRPSVHVPELPLAFEAVIIRCLERRVENRFQNAAELIQALAPFASPSGQLSSLPEPPSGLGFGRSSRPSFASPAPSLPSPEAITTGDPPRSAPNAVVGASTPVGMVQPQVGWQTTGDAGNGAPTMRTSVMLVAIGFGLVAVIGLLGIGFSMFHGRSRATIAGAGAASSPPPLPASAVPAAPPPPPSTAPPTAETAASASAAVTAPPPRVVVHRPAAPPTPPVAAPPVVAAPPTPTKKGNGDPLQNSR